MRRAQTLTFTTNLLVFLKLIHCLSCQQSVILVEKIPTNRDVTYKRWQQRYELGGHVMLHPHSKLS